MKRMIRVVAAVAVVTALAVPAARAADKEKSPPAASPSTSKAPERFDGEVVSIDENRGVMMVRMPDGSVQEFRGNRDTLKDYKVGDKIEGRLRAPAR